jgi:hypothetical protein
MILSPEPRSYFLTARRWSIGFTSEFRSLPGTYNSVSARQEDDNANTHSL